MLILFEGLICCLFVLLSCVAGIANGPANMVFFYDDEVQERAIELGLTDRAKIKKNRSIFMFCGIIPYFVFVVTAVYIINKARRFLDPFLQMTAILLIEGVFDRIFIDWWWVGHTKAWIIEGTEDLRPYIDRKALIRKWAGTLIGFPMISAVIALLMKAVLK